MKELSEKDQHVLIRKYSLGVASVLLGTVFLSQGQLALADQVTDLKTAKEERVSPVIEEIAQENPPSLPLESGKTSIVLTEEPLDPLTAKTPQSSESLILTKEAPTNTTTNDGTRAIKEVTNVADTTFSDVSHFTREAIVNEPTGVFETREAKSDPLGFQETDRNKDRAISSIGQTRSAQPESVSVARGDDYPNRFKYSSTGIDDWRLVVNQCTSFTAHRLSSVNGFDLPPAYGNGGEWGYRAKREGYRVDQTPGIGSVAWLDDGSYGHVAWVSNIIGSAVEIEEYNYNWSQSYNKRTAPISSFSGFIHFKDLKGDKNLATAPTPQTISTSGLAQSGTYTFTQRAGIRAAANMASPELAHYEAGQSVNYDRKVTENGYEWLSYLSYSGNRRYIAIKEIVQPTTGNIRIQQDSKRPGTFEIIISNVSHSKEIQSVIVPTWSDKDGQDDIQWYVASRQADGTYHQTVKVSDHKNTTGLYHAHLYYREQDGNLVGAGVATTTVEQAKPQNAQQTIPSSGTYRFTTRGSVRAQARMTSAELAHYNPGMTVYYDRVLQSEGRTWLSYIAASGNRRYIAIN